MPNTKELNYFKMFQDIGSVCMGEGICGKCRGKNCFVGYARECIGEARSQDTDTLPDGMKNLPLTDYKGGYDKVHALRAVAHTLGQCKSCKEYHYEECLINIVRSCFEIIAFGDEQKYEGSALLYMGSLQEKFPEEALIILEEYKKADE